MDIPSSSKEATKTPEAYTLPTPPDRIQIPGRRSSSQNTRLNAREKGSPKATSRQNFVQPVVTPEKENTPSGSTTPSDPVSEVRRGYGGIDDGEPSRPLPGCTNRYLSIDPSKRSYKSYGQQHNANPNFGDYPKPVGNERFAGMRDYDESVEYNGSRGWFTSEQERGEYHARRGNYNSRGGRAGRGGGRGGYHGSSHRTPSNPRKFGGSRNNYGLSYRVEHQGDDSGDIDEESYYRRHDELETQVGQWSPAEGDNPRGSEYWYEQNAPAKMPGSKEEVEKPAEKSMPKEEVKKVAEKEQQADESLIFFSDEEDSIVTTGNKAQTKSVAPISSTKVVQEANVSASEEKNEKNPKDLILEKPKSAESGKAHTPKVVTTEPTIPKASEHLDENNKEVDKQSPDFNMVTTWKKVIIDEFGNRKVVKVSKDANSSAASAQPIAKTNDSKNEAFVAPVPKKTVKRFLAASNPPPTSQRIRETILASIKEGDMCVDESKTEATSVNQTTPTKTPKSPSGSSVDSSPHGGVKLNIGFGLGRVSLIKKNPQVEEKIKQSENHETTELPDSGDKTEEPDNGEAEISEDEEDFEMPEDDAHWQDEWPVDLEDEPFSDDANSSLPLEEYLYQRALKQQKAQSLGLPDAYSAAYKSTWYPANTSPLTPKSFGSPSKPSGAVFQDSAVQETPHDGAENDDVPHDSTVKNTLSSAFASKLLENMRTRQESEANRVMSRAEPDDAEIIERVFGTLQINQPTTMRIPTRRVPRTQATTQATNSGGEGSTAASPNGMSSATAGSVHSQGSGSRADVSGNEGQDDGEESAAAQVPAEQEAGQDNGATNPFAGLPPFDTYLANEDLEDILEGNERVRALAEMYFPEDQIALGHSVFDYIINLVFCYRRARNHNLAYKNAYGAVPRDDNYPNGSRGGRGSPRGRGSRGVRGGRGGRGGSGSQSVQASA